MPDPKHTHLSLFFDRTMEAIQQAAADDNYVFRGAYTPWDDRDHPEPSALQERLKVEEYQRNTEQSPGLLIFDRPRDKNPAKSCVGKPCTGRDLLMVFVVGERPTAGINKSQFKMSVSLQNGLRQLIEGSKAVGPLLVFGPTFSGSLISLNQLTHKQPSSTQGSGGLPSTKSEPLTAASSSSPAISVVALSGTITGTSSIGALEKDRQDVLFASLQKDDDYVLGEIQTFFTLPHRRTNKQIAMLSEDETAYGHIDSNNIVNLYFPREISHLRSAYQEAHASRATSSKDESTTLPLDLENTGADDDTVSVFSKKQLPLSQEAVLLGLVSQLRAHHVSLILIRATDPLDQLFLAKYRRVAYPPGRLLMIGSDSLFRREIQDSDLLGTFAVSNYFDFPRPPGCSNPSVQPVHTRVFPSANSAGSYYAFRALLSTLALRSGDDTGKALTRDDFKSLISTPPCLVLAALGHDGYWPIATLPVNPSALLPRSTSLMPLGWRIFQTAVALLAIAYCLVLFRPTIFDPEESVAMMARVPGEGRTGVVAILSLISLTIVWIAVWPNVILGRWSNSTRFVALAGLLLVAITSYDLYNRRHKEGVLGKVKDGSEKKEPQKGQTSFFAVKIFLAALAPVLSVLVVWLTTNGTRSQTQYFSMYRAVHLSSGLSPILPLILLCCAGWWWAFHTIAGSTLLDRRKTLLPRRARWRPLPQSQPLPLAKAQAVGGTSVESSTDCGGRAETAPIERLDASGEAQLTPVMSVLHDQHARLMSIVRPNFVDWKIIAALISCLAGVLAVVEVRYPLLSLENSAYDGLLMLFIAAALVALIGTTLRVRRIWMELRPLLISLDSVPFRKAFARIRDMRCIELFRVGGDLADFRRAVARQNEALQAAIGTYLPESSLVPLQGIREEMIKAFKVARHQVETGDEPKLRSTSKPSSLVNQFEQYQQEMADLARSVLINLSSYWSSPEGRRRAEKTALDATAAEDFVALLYANFLSIVLTRIRSLIIAISGMYVFTLIALSMYPFEQRTMIRLVLVAVLCFMFSVVTVVYSGIHRDAVVSALTSTNPGELGGIFWLKIISFAALPVFSFAAAQFPELKNLLFSWVEPALQAFGR